MSDSTNNGKPWLTLMADFGRAWGWELPPMSAEEVSKPETGAGLMALAAGDSDARKEFGISDGLAADIEAWQARCEDWNPYEKKAEFDWAAFDAEGLELARRLKAEIGDRYNIRFHFEGDGKHGRTEVV